MRWQSALCAALGLAGCVAFPHPMTGQDLVRLDSGDALVAYLGQSDASPTVCDSQARGPHLRHFDGSMRTSLVRGLTDGQIDPALWGRCVDAALDGATPGDVALLLDAIGKGYRSTIESSVFEGSPPLQARLTAMQRVFVEGPSRSDGHPNLVAQPMLDDVRKALDAHRLGPIAKRFAEEILAIADLDRGRYGGRAVDVAVIDDLYARRNETLLRRFIEHVPSSDLRDEARRRVIRLRIAASPFAEVRASAEQVEARVFQQGFNRISPTQQPALHAWLDNQKTARRGVLVRQDVSKQRATLLGYGDRPGLSVLPELSLVGTLWVEVTGLSRPITLCQAPKMLDPSPCIGADDVKVDNPLAYLDQGGAFHLVDHITAADVVSLARAGQFFHLPISVGGSRLLSLDWWLHFEQPQGLLFVAGALGSGPNLTVAIDHTDPARFSFSVSRAGADYRAVVEKADLAAFRVVSRGAAGFSGSTGMTGSDGSPGIDGAGASCPSTAGGDGSRGGDGSNGGPGGDGGLGGNGGDIQVQVDCGATGCSPQVLDSLQGIIVSEGGPGGPGGPGGRGGRGGRGGSGGSGTSCIDNSGGSVSSLGAGSSGMDGNDGSSGISGGDGPPGRPGQIRFSVRTAR